MPVVLRPSPSRFPTVVRPGLERIARVLARLGHPEDSFASVLIAGTNGKGTVSSLLESSLRATGWRTGLYTSPHLIHVTERVRLQGKSLSPKVWAGLERRVALAGRGLGLTEFEAHTALAFLAFAEAGTEIAVVEVGLGGRLDATNILPVPELTVITSIGHDHQTFLGNRLSEIYREKRGIARPGIPLVQNIPRSLWGLSHRWAEDEGVPLWTFGREFHCSPPRPDWNRGGQTVATKIQDGETLSAFLPFLGAHQADNAAVAMVALHLLSRRGWGTGDRERARGFASATWPGRFQILNRRPPLVVDGAHNVEAAQALRRTWSSAPWGSQKATLLFSCLQDKDARGLVRALAPIVRRVVVVPLATPRARRPEDLCALWRSRVPVESAAGLRDALRRTRGEPLLMAGSLYLVGEALAALRKKAVG